MNRWQRRLEVEVNDITNRLQTHLDGKKKNYGFEWGSIQFYFEDDGSIYVKQESVGSFVFITARAAAEFVVLNVIPQISETE